MNNLECAIAVIASHRTAGQWSDDVVASDLLAQLGLDARGEAKDATVKLAPEDISEEEVKLAEAVADDASKKAKAARDKLTAQQAPAEEVAEKEDDAKEDDTKADKKASSAPLTGPAKTTGPGKRA